MRVEVQLFSVQLEAAVDEGSVDGKDAKRLFGLKFDAKVRVFLSTPHSDCVETGAI